MRHLSCDLLLGSSSNSWTVTIGSSSCAPVAFFSSSSMKCLSKALAVGLGTSLPMVMSIANLTSMSSSFSYNAPILVSHNATSASGLPTEGGGWFRVFGSNLFPIVASGVRAGSRFFIFFLLLFLGSLFKSHRTAALAQPWTGFRLHRFAAQQQRLVPDRLLLCP
jgi:hypothetical protein